MSAPRIGSLCSGYGGLEMGVAAILGARVVWHAEIDTAARRVLAYRRPGVPNHGDVTAIDWSAVEPVEVITAGFPCQSVAAAGRRAGLLSTGDVDQPPLVPLRSPWEGVIAAVTVIRPQLVIIENVRGLLSAPVLAVGPDRAAVGGAFGRVLGDLADRGFDAEWACVGAHVAGAAHRRRRVFVVAAAAHTRGQERARWPGLRPSWSTELGGRRPDDGVMAAGDGWGDLRPALTRWAGIVDRPPPDGLVLGRDGGLITNARFVEWLMGLPAGHVCDVPLIPEDTQRRLLGNGVVPHQAALVVGELLDRLFTDRRAA